MKIVLFGARGRTGQQLLTLLSNHEVLPFQGDALDAELVLETVRGCDAVISVIGHVSKSDPLVQTKAIVNILAAMERHGVRRLISLTGTGVRQPGDVISVMDRLLNLGVSLLDTKRIKDGRTHANAIAQTDLDWTILRVLKLTNGRSTNQWELSEHGPAKTLISRRDVASAIVDILNENRFVQQMPIVSRRS